MHSRGYLIGSAQVLIIRRSTPTECSVRFFEAAVWFYTLWSSHSRKTPIREVDRPDAFDSDTRSVLDFVNRKSTNTDSSFAE